MHHLQQLLFCDRSTSRVLAGCDVRVRLMVALLAIVAVVASTRVWFGLIALGVCLAGLIVLRTSMKVLLGRLVGPVVLAAVVLLARTFMTGVTPWFSIPLGTGQLTATWEGFWAGSLIASRVLGSLGIVMLVCQGMSAERLFAALRWARVPRTWIEIAVLMYRYLHIFFERAVCVIAAQRVRLGYSAPRRSLHSLGSLAGIVILGALEQAEKSHEAMLARGYQGFLPFPPLPALPRKQMAIGGIALALIAMAYAAAERWTL
jgi:cobalt/nickel transport system permease protein